MSSDRSLISHIQNIFEALLENRFTAFAGVCAGAAGLLPDQFKWVYFILFPAFILFCILGTWHKLKEKHKYLQTAIAIPIVIKIASKHDANNALNDLFASIEAHGNLGNYQNNLAKYLHVDREELLFEYGSDDRDIFETERLMRFFAVVKYGINQLQRRAPQATFNLAFIGPISIAIALGTLFNQTPVTIFHFDNGTRKYFPVLAIDRKLRERDVKLQKFKLTDSDGNSLDSYFDIQKNTGIPTPPWQEKVTLAIQVSTHSIFVQEDQNLYGQLLYMRDTGNGTIDIYKPEEWVQRCREIYRVINVLQERYHVTAISLIYSMPIALGVALGISLQNLWKIGLMNYNKQTSAYEHVLYLNDINVEF